MVKTESEIRMEAVDEELGGVIGWLNAEESKLYVNKVLNIVNHVKNGFDVDARDVEIIRLLDGKNEARFLDWSAGK